MGRALEVPTPRYIRHAGEIGTAPEGNTASLKTRSLGTVSVAPVSIYNDYFSHVCFILWVCDVRPTNGRNTIVIDYIEIYRTFVSLFSLDKNGRLN